MSYVSEIQKIDDKLGEEAEVERASSIEQTNRFCPLLRTHCVQDCQCFTPARHATYKLSDNSMSKPNIIAAFCDNAMFHMDRQCYMQQ